MEEPSAKRSRSESAKDVPRSVSVIIMISEQADLTTVVSYDDVIDGITGLRAALQELATGEPWKRPKPGGRMSIDAFLDAVDDIGIDETDDPPKLKRSRDLTFPFHGTTERPISRVYVFYDFE
jgi:hypothetical protein